MFTLVYRAYSSGGQLLNDELKTKDQLTEELTYFRAAMDATSDAIGISTPDGQHFYSNQACIKMFGWEHGDFTRHHPSEAYADQKVAKEVFSTIMAGNCWLGEVEMVAKDGRHFPSFLRANAVRNAKGEIVAIMGTHTDITERKRAEAERLALDRQVQQTQKLESLGVLAGGIAHDFNNLLMGILGNADLVLSNLPPTDTARQKLLDIETATKQAADLTRQMLAYSGKGRFILQNIELKTLIEEMVPLLNVSISKKVVIKYDFAPDLPPIEADATQIRQIVMNLVVNASEAIGQKSGNISIHTGLMACDQAYFKQTFLDDELAEGPYAYFEVKDEGSGMDQETLNQIFDPFFSTKFHGRGLGLAALIGIVRSHQGAIKVDSEPGVGSTFKVLFPLAKTDSSKNAESEPPKPDFAKLSGKTALFADDDGPIRNVAQQMLEQLGIEVITTKNGREALERFKVDSDRFDCIILDLNMPELDGVEAFHKIRCIRNDIPVFLSSGYNEHDLASRSVKQGFAGFIPKPYKTTDIGEVLLKAFNSNTLQ